MIEDIMAQKLHAAGLPKKCNPGIEDSNPRLSTGKPFTVFSCFDNDGDKKGYLETSTRNPVGQERMIDGGIRPIVQSKTKLALPRQRRISPCAPT